MYLPSRAVSLCASTAAAVMLRLPKKLSQLRPLLSKASLKTLSRYTFCFDGRCASKWRVQCLATASMDTSVRAGHQVRLRIFSAPAHPGCQAALLSFAAYSNMAGDLALPQQGRPPPRPLVAVATAALTRLTSCFTDNNHEAKPC